MDLRIKRTNKLINEAFIKLIAEKGFDKVTIQDIAEEAMINRATFYAHYKDKQDLFDQILDEFMKRFSFLLKSSEIVQADNVEVKHIKKLLTRFYDNLKKNPAVAKALISSSNKEIITEKFVKMLNEQYDDIFKTVEVKNNGANVPIDFVIAYLTSIFVGTLVWWVQNQDQIEPQRLAELVIKLVSNGHLTVLGINVIHEKN
ncbi:MULTISPECIES: TetR/AcrR family transcriptional regulator [unclassified Enterococcus]|uniref:TetR/AcrR family transcriptional regulator n=1 Tax=unclassified Enterococcus TaxID=2608891 RepID=UPI001557D873|nr:MULTISPECIES: TetR/AcrR family transcriptional regulator [unclassified Enterococcus]MBS7576744.1 TetR/AcrR family transcriptional regulator [Enterococcus sp. MMGLQ5-2]MBS7583769.1 TetR/AcrR family transcriptional regulator [Enterococcus sp. MMGLQ5-1]NPD11630.1 TetR/AcrR family transcriptional regulator [Enterococcus sp. MMGLQ5-1]NPD36581.1 TetR/AcrR family transcriptional regulator [Enterococcus sp. MMGLQ5-2]